MKKYVIKSGRHSSGLHISPYLGDKTVQFRAIFDKSCLYRLNSPDDGDINKLCGVSFGFHHHNSVRIGWNCDTNDGIIDLYAYYYNHKKRYSFQTGTVLPGEEIELFFIFNYEIAIYINGKCYVIPFDFTGVPMLGYKLFPYFGGTTKSPHDMTIWLKS